MPPGLKENVNEKEIMDLVLKLQEDVDSLKDEIRGLLGTYKGIPGHFSRVIMSILAEGKKPGILQRISVLQSVIRGLPGIVYNADLQRIAAYLGDEFNLFEDMRRLIIDLVSSRESGQDAALIDEIKELCDTVAQRIADVRSSVAVVSSAL